LCIWATNSFGSPVFVTTLWYQEFASRPKCPRKQKENHLSFRSNRELFPPVFSAIRKIRRQELSIGAFEKDGETPGPHRSFLLGH